MLTVPLGNKKQKPFTQYSAKNSLTLVHKPHKTLAWPSAALLSLPSHLAYSFMAHSFSKAHVSSPGQNQQAGSPWIFNSPLIKAKCRSDLRISREA